MHDRRWTQIAIHVNFSLVIRPVGVQSIIQVLVAPLALVVILVFLNHVLPALGVVAFLRLERVNQQKRIVLTQQALPLQPTTFLIFGYFFS